MANTRNTAFMQKVFVEPGGLTGYAAVPAGSTNGTLIGTAPAGAQAVRLFLPSASDNVTFVLAASQPASAPSPTVTVAGVTGGASWTEPLNGLDPYITATTGSPLFRFI